MTLLLHLVHVGLAGFGLIVVLVLLAPNRSAAATGRDIERLRRAASTGSLVADAEDHARRLLSAPHVRRDAGPAGGRAVLGAAALGSVAAAAVHALVTPEHYTEGLRFGLFFTLLSLLQVGWAVALVARPARGVVGGAVVLNVGVVLVWVATRTVGLPWGLAEVEGVGPADALAGLAELVIIAGCLAYLARAGAPATRPTRPTPPARRRELPVTR